MDEPWGYARVPSHESDEMTASIRRVVRLTVLLPDTQVDVAVADDAVAAEVVRTARSAAGPRSHTPGDLDGWTLVHPTLGALPPNVRLEEVWERTGGLPDGSVLSLVPRGSAETAPPVDDVAEHVARLRTGTGRPSSPLLPGLLALGTPVVAAAVLASHGAPVRQTALAALLVAFATLLLIPRTPGTAGPGDADGLDGGVVVGVAGVLVMAGAAALAVLPAGLPVILTAAGAAAALGALRLAASDPRLRVVLLVAVATAGLAGLVGLARHVAGGPRGLAVGVLAATVLAAGATHVSLATSGLGRLDDRVARGESVGEATVDAALARASADLAAMLWVVAAATPLLAVPLAASGWWGGVSAIVFALVVVTQARSVVRPVHVVPLVLGGGLALVGVVTWGLGESIPAAVPALAVAVSVLVAALGAAIARGLHPVTASRMRQGADLLCRVGTLLPPLFVAGVFDLYRVVWSLPGV